MTNEFYNLLNSYEIKENLTSTSLQAGKTKKADPPRNNDLANARRFQDANGDTYTDYIKRLSDSVIQEVKSKEKMRTKVANFLCVFFVSISIFVCIFLFLANNYDSKLVMVVAGGFFANSVSLVLVLLKYVYSSSEELFTHTSNVLKSIDKQLENSLSFK